MSQQLMSPTEAAATLDISIPTFYDRIKRSKVKLIKQGHRSFIQQSDLKRLLSYEVSKFIEVVNG